MYSDPEYDQDTAEYTSSENPVDIADAYRTYKDYEKFHSLESVEHGTLRGLVGTYDWAGAIEAVRTYGPPTARKYGNDQDSSWLTDILRKVPIGELTTLYEQLEYAGGNVIPENPNSRYIALPFSQRRTKLEQQTLYSQFQKAYDGGADTRDSFITSLDKEKAILLHDKLAAQLSTTLSELPLSEGVHGAITERQLRTYDTLRSVGYGWYYETIDDIKNAVVEDAQAILEGTKPGETIEAIETLVRIDGQYVAHYLQSDTLPAGISRQYIVGALGRHDTELLTHLVHEGVVTTDEIRPNLSRMTQHAPAAALEVTIAIPELCTDEMVNAISKSLTLNQLYQAAHRSAIWQKALRTSPVVKETVRRQIDEATIGTENDPFQRLRMLSRFSNFPGAEQTVAKQKHAVLSELVKAYSLTSVEMDENVFDAPGSLKTLTAVVPEIANLPEKDQVYLNALTYMQRDMAPNEAFEIDTQVFLLRRLALPAERQTMAEAIIERAQSIPAGQNEEYSLVDATAAITSLIPAEAELSEETSDALTKLGHRLMDIYPEIEYPEYGVAASVASLLNYTKDKDLATRLAGRMSGENMELLFSDLDSDDYAYLSWMKLLAPAERAALLAHCENPAVAILHAQTLLADAPAQRTALTENILRKHPQLRSFATPVGQATWQRFSKLQHYPEIPSAETNLGPLLRLEHNFGETVVKRVLQDIFLDHLTGPHAEKLGSVLQFALARNNALDTHFTLTYALKLLQQGCDADLIIDTLQTMPEHLTNHDKGYYLDYTPFSEATTPDNPGHASVKHSSSKALHGNLQYVPPKIKRWQADAADYSETALLRLQRLTTGMTRDTVQQGLEAFPKPPYGSDIDSMRRVVGEGYFGQKFHTFYTHRHAILELLTQESVVDDSLDISDILDSEDVGATISVLRHNAADLSTSIPVWQRHANIAADLVLQANLQGGKYSREDLFVPTASGPQKFADVDNDTYRTATAKALERILDIPTPERRQASERNMETAEDIAIYGGGFALPPGTLLHETTAAAKILASANLAGELTGTLSLDTDSYPGFVDVLQIDTSWNEATLGNFAAHPNRYSLSKEGSVLVYLPDRRVDTQPIASMHLGHRLAFAGIPNTDLGLIMHYSEDPDSLQELTEAQVEAGLYVPVVDKTGKLLFSPDEFAERHTALKRFKSLHELARTEGIYQTELYTRADPGGVGSIAAHMEHSVRNAERMLPEANLPPELHAVVRGAMKLHDTGKLDAGAQEYSNVIAARKYLAQIDDISIEAKRRVLLLIRNDELLGEVLKSFDLTDENYRTAGVIPRATRTKLEQFNKTFSDDELRRAALVVYQADVAAKRAEAWDEWQLDEKLAALNLPNYRGALRRHS